MDQQELRKQIKRRCMSQKEIAGILGVTNVHLNYWLKGKKTLGPKTVDKAITFLNEQ